MSDISKMRGKLFLLAVVCVSFVQVRGDHNSENPLERGFSMLTEGNHDVDLFETEIQPSNREVNKTSDEELEDAIFEALITTDSIHKLTVRLLLKQWTNVNDIRQIIATNSTDYTKKAKKDEERMGKAVLKAADNAREEARYLENSKIIVECVDKAENQANTEIVSSLKTFVAEIWHLNYEFNKTHPEYPFLMLEEVLKHPFNRTIQSIKACQDTACVKNAVLKYKTEMSDFYNAYLKDATNANNNFITHQQETSRFYRVVTRQIEQIYLTAVGDFRKCLYIRPIVIGKLLDFN